MYTLAHVTTSANAQFWRLARRIGKKKVEHFPIVLFGSESWQGLIDWIAQQPLDEGKISPADVDLLTVTDDIDEAPATILKRHEARIEAERSQRSTEHALKQAESR